VPHFIREQTEEHELAWLSPYAAKARESAGRVVDIPEDPVRTVFQRDRDRILHSKPFRRLKHKTQVFIDPAGDHYRTRLTHSLEVAQIARTIGRALRLNEDLIEAIALGHDVGHTPFGHAGEAALDAALQAITSGSRRFFHHEQSLRIVDHLEKLNLTKETRLGIGGHSKGRNDLTAFDGEPTSTLEAAVVRISDRIAYMNHDLDDAVRSGMIAAIPQGFTDLGPTHAKRVAAMVTDVIENSHDKPAIQLSAGMLRQMNELKEWLFDNVYLQYPVRFPDILKAQNMVKELFVHFVDPGALPEDYEGVQGAVDYLAGMTDRYAIETYKRLKLPAAWPLP
jgi:dGTPase